MSGYNNLNEHNNNESNGNDESVPQAIEECNITSFKSCESINEKEEFMRSSLDDDDEDEDTFPQDGYPQDGYSQETPKASSNLTELVKRTSHQVEIKKVRYTIIYISPIYMWTI